MTAPICPHCSGTGEVLLRYHRTDIGQPGECRHCKGRGTDPCCLHPSTHYSTPGPVKADWSLVSLVPNDRVRGRAWPGCQVRCARQPFDWCGQHGRWWFGQQIVCDEHADSLRRGDALYGLYPDGRWCTATRLNPVRAHQGLLGAHRQRQASQGRVLATSGGGPPTCCRGAGPPMTCPHGMPSPGSCVECMDEGPLPPKPQPKWSPIGRSFAARYRAICPQCRDDLNPGDRIVRAEHPEQGDRFVHADHHPSVI